MKARAVLTLLAGLGLAGFAVYAVHEQLQERTGLVAAEPPFPVTTLVVAHTDLAYGDRLGPEHLREATWPQDALPAGGFTHIADLLGEDDERRVVLRSMTAGEPVLASKVSGFGGRATMSAALPDGKRAVAISINDVSGVAGFILPGDRVDILLTRGGRGDQVTDIILQNITVRGINQIADEERDRPTTARTATVEVTPEEAQKLALAQQVGSLSLALRQVGTVEQAETQTVRIQDLVPREAAGPTRQTRTIRVRRGSSVSVEEF
jgi:pilus assembly protein CpaB